MKKVSKIDEARCKRERLRNRNTWVVYTNKKLSRGKIKPEDCRRVPRNWITAGGRNGS